MGKNFDKLDYRNYFFYSNRRKLFSSLQQYNPILYNWNKVEIKYCDLSAYLSNVNKYGLYFRGKNNILSLLYY